MLLSLFLSLFVSHVFNRLLSKPCTPTKVDIIICNPYDTTRDRSEYTGAHAACLQTCLSIDIPDITGKRSSLIFYKSLHFSIT